MPTDKKFLKSWNNYSMPQVVCVHYPIKISSGVSRVEGYSFNSHNNLHGIWLEIDK